jgi:O-antigen/teichoic acid export membrane protein
MRGELTEAPQAAGDAARKGTFHKVTADAAWNLVGQVTPMVAAFFTIPPLIRGLGEERFGVLALAWIVIGYFSFLDLGLGRALTQVVAGRPDANRDDDLGEYIGSAILALLALGVMGGIALVATAPWLVEHVLNVPPALRSETIASFRLIGASIPLVTLTSAYRGLVEARRWFGPLNLVRIPLGLFTFVGPWLIVLFSRSLVAVIGVLLVGRVAGTMAHRWLARRAFAHVTVSWRLRPHILRRLLGVGGWMTVTNIVGPLMVNLDRFIIGSMMSLSAVSLYSTPYEVVTKLLVVGVALSAALFPVVSAARDLADVRELAALKRRAYLLILATLGPVVVVCILGAQWGLALWISPEFSAGSAGVLRILAVGVLLNALAMVPFTMIQGMGRPDWTAILHIVELPIYLGMLWMLIRVDGIRGAALAWTLRVAIDAVVLAFMGRRLVAVAQR